LPPPVRPCGRKGRKKKKGGRSQGNAEGEKEEEESARLYDLFLYLFVQRRELGVQKRKKKKEKGGRGEREGNVVRWGSLKYHRFARQCGEREKKKKGREIGWGLKKKGQ